MSDLIDRQALLDECLNHYEVGNIEQNCTMDWICKTVRNFPAAPRWHRVEDVLPGDTRDVLAVRRYGNDLEKQEVIVAHLSVIMDMKRGFDKWWNATNITHWMPFPEPPKEDGERREG